MSRTGSKAWLVFLLVCAAALAVGWIVWLQPSGRADVVAGGEPAAAQPPTPLPSLVESSKTEAVEEGTRRPTNEAKPSPSPKPAVPAATMERPTITLIADFTLPDKTKIRVDRAGVDLVDVAGAVHHVDVQNAPSVEVPSVATGRYTLRVVAPGYEHREQTLDVTPENEHGSADPNGSFHRARIVLWPADWIAVIVQTNEGQSFSVIADELGLEPMKLFVGAFQVRTRLDAPVPGEANVADDTSLAKFSPPPEHKSWEITKSCIGSLQLRHPPPLWVGLDVFGTNQGWELLSPAQREIVFHLDLAGFETLLARVALRIVDASDRSPVAQALVTLRADSSAHRRKDQASVPTGDDGRLELTRVVPGRYEIEVFRGESQHQEMIELRPGERRDLGDIPLGNSAGFEVLVEDYRGQPASAWVEIGPYKKGARNGDIYPQMMRHQSDERGRCRLPLPSDSVIVRAALEDGRSNGPGSAQEVVGARSANVFVDPRSIPPAPIRLRLESSQPVRLTTNRPEGTRFEVLDELDVVVARSVHPDEHKLSIGLVPGRYRVRGVASDGSTSPEVAFTVQHDPVTISLD